MIRSAGRCPDPEEPAPGRWRRRLARRPAHYPFWDRGRPWCALGWPSPWDSYGVQRNCPDEIKRISGRMIIRGIIMMAGSTERRTRGG